MTEERTNKSPFLQVTIRGGLYIQYVEDWLQVFPREQLHFVHYESYVQNRSEELSHVVQFTGLGKYNCYSPFFKSLLVRNPIGPKAH